MSAVGGHRGSDPKAIEIADQLGLLFDGMQRGAEKPFQFTIPKGALGEGITFYVDDPSKAEARLKEKLREFGTSNIDENMLADGVSTAHLSTQPHEVPVSGVGTVDVGIADHLRAINEAGFKSVMSCSGLIKDHPENPEFPYSKQLSKGHGSGYIAFWKNDITPEKERLIEAAAKAADLTFKESDIFFIPGVNVTTGQLKSGKSYSEVLKEASREAGLNVSSPDFMEKLAIRDEIMAKKYKEHGGHLLDTDEKVEAAWDKFTKELTGKAVKTPSAIKTPFPVVIERFPPPPPEEMDLGGDIGKIRIKIPPARGTPVPPKKIGITAAPEAPQVLTEEEYERDWKPKGWKLLAIGPTSTWRQDWGIWEAIRDIVQNALDETEAYRWGYDEQGLWIADNGRGVSVIDFLLGPPKLKPEYARGRYGEGMKISTLVLVRNGFPVHISTVGKELWVVFLELDIEGAKTHQLNALYKADGSSRGTRFSIIGYTGSAYEDRFAVNIPEKDILWKSPSLITQPKQRYNMLYASHFPVSEGAGAGRIFARDIYMRDINSPFSYNLWSFNLAPDRHAPANENDVWTDIGRLWATVTDVDLLETFLKMVKDPPDIECAESRLVNMNHWDMGTDPDEGLTYEQIIKANAESWKKAWDNVCGEDAVIRTNEKMDNVIKHLGYQSVSLNWGVRDALSQVVSTDKVIKDLSQEKLRETEIVPDEQLDQRQMAHLQLARAIAADIFAVRPVAGVYAAIIPPASDRVRTAGMYGTTTQTIYINLDILFRGRDTIDTLVHEMAHNRQFQSTGEAEDLTESHAGAMTQIAAAVVEALAKGKYKEALLGVSW